MVDTHGRFVWYELTTTDVEAARTFKLLSHAEVASLLERVRAAALDGKYELYKTTPRNDGTARRPQFLG